jgi:hypothetical protein
MTSNNWLFVTIIGLFGLTCYMIATRPEITQEEREKMEEEWWG